MIGSTDMLDYSQGSAFVNGQLIPIAEAKISLLDWGFLRSDATYDVVHVWRGQFFRLNDHLQRFFSGLDRLRLNIPHSREAVESIITDCVRASQLQDAYVEMIATRGLPAPGSRDPRTCNNQFFAFAVPFVWIAKPNQPLALIISQQQRIPPESVDATVKNYHWLDLVMGQFEAYDKGGETAVVVDAKGNLKEGPGFNLFAVKDGVLMTPAHGVLSGITRQTVIELAAEYGYPVLIDEMTVESAYQADELFATSTAGGIMPITSIDHRTVGQGGVGSMTSIIQEAYWARHDNPLYSTAIDYRKL